MATFHFEAITKDGERIQGKVDARDTLTAVQALQDERGYSVVAMKTDDEIARVEEDRRRLQHEREDLERQKREAEVAIVKKQVEDALAESRLQKAQRSSRDWFKHEPQAQEKKPGLIAGWFAKRKKAKKKEVAMHTKHLTPSSAAPKLVAAPKGPGLFARWIQRFRGPEHFGPPAPPAVDTRPLFARMFAHLFPERAAKTASAQAAQHAAETAKDAAHVARRLAVNASNMPLDELRFSKALGVTLVPHSKRGKYAKELRESRRQLRHERQSEHVAAMSLAKGAKLEEQKRGLGQIDLTKNITGRQGDARHLPPSVLADHAKAARIDLDLAKIEIPQTGFRELVRQMKLRYLLWQKNRLAKAEAKRKEEVAKRLRAIAEAKQKALLSKQKAALKAAKAKAKAEAEADRKGMMKKTLVMGGKAVAVKLTWYQKLFPSLFKPKGAVASTGGKRLNFSTTEEQQNTEKERMMLLIQGFKPTGNPFVDAWAKLNDFLVTHSKIKLKELVTFYNLIAVMINAGIPLVKSLHQLVDQQKNPRFKRILFQIVYEIENGKSLSKSMKSFPDVFSDAHIGMVEAGEASGQLGSVMKRIAEEAEKSHKMLSKVKGALMYPMVILIILVIVMVVVMVAVVPKMVEVFTGAGVDLPLPTRVLIAMSDFIIKRWYILIAVVASVIGGFTTYIKTEEGHYYWDYAKLKLPIFGVLMTKVALARFTRSLSSLSQSGLSIIKALRINADSVGNEIFRQEILATSESVKKGVSIAKDLKGNKLFPAMVVDMIEVGEETAQVANVAQKISEFYENEVEDMVKNMQSLMEPIIIVVVGIMVGGLVAAIMLPIMKLSEVATAG